MGRFPGFHQEINPCGTWENHPGFMEEVDVDARDAAPSMYWISAIHGDIDGLDASGYKS